MAKGYTKKQKKQTEKFVKHHWKGILYILFILVLALLILYFTGTLQVLYDKFFKKEPHSPFRSDKDTTTVVDELDDLIITFLDVGQGDCIIIELPDGKNMIIDSGDNRGDSKDISKSAITEFTEEKNITSFDYLLLTHQDSDHAGNMAWVIDTYDIGYIFRPNNKTSHTASANKLTDEQNTGNGYVSSSATYGKFMVSAYNEGCTVEVFNKNSDFTNKVVCGDNTYTYYFDFLTPTSDTISYSDPNNYSPVMLFDFMGTRILFTGDAEEKNLGEYVSTYGDEFNVDILKVGHHGSKNATTDAFVQAIDPEYAIIQCGEGNSYGHPHAEALNMLSGYDDDMIIYRTDNNGNIVLTISPDGSFEFTLEKAYDKAKNLTPGVKTESKSTNLRFEIILDDKKLKVA